MAGDGHTEAVPLRSLTVRQPWAWAIMQGMKDVENRRWGTDLGTIAVSAGLKLSMSPADTLAMTGQASLPVGVIVGTVDIVDVHLADHYRGCHREADVLGWTPFDGSDASEPGWEPRLCSRWAHVPRVEARSGSGRMRHFVLANPRRLEHPVPFRGHQGMRRLDPAVAATVAARLASQEPAGK